MNRLKQRIAAGEQVAAAWLELGNPDIAEIMVRHGWTTLVIDGEHGVGDLDDWVAVARAVEAAGGEVVLRVPDEDAVVDLDLSGRTERLLLRTPPACPSCRARRPGVRLRTATRPRVEL